ncbi:CAP domain-containing protein [Paenibacillus sp. FA6]|uniref:CAP domain-containing protein n=1 Tax=Paenibacillus sp. FA6 TaxID=3413029 RepID=UPI003F658060
MRKRISSLRRVKRNPSKISERVRKPRRIRIRQAKAYELQVFKLVNEERTSRGIAAITLNSTLTDLAILKSRDMRDNNYFGHTSPTYGTPGEMLDRYGVSNRAYGENIAAGQTTPEEVMRVWMNSPGHREDVFKIQKPLRFNGVVLYFYALK